MADSTPFYKKYGLKANPFFVKPLSAYGSLNLDEAFVGRGKEAEKLRKVINGSSRRRVAVAGKSGVGKTTLVNKVRNEFTDSYLVLLNPIEITEETTGSHIIYRTVNSIYEEARAKEIDVPEDFKQEIMKTKGVIKEGENERGLPDRDKLIRILIELKEIILESGRNGIVVHYDNLDTIKTSEEVRKILNELRDFTQKITTIFVGDYKLADSIRNEKRLNDNFADTVTLDPFSKEDVRNILDKRYELLKIEEAPHRKPHSDEFVDVLHEIHEGNLRSILDSLNVAIEELPPSNRPQQLKKEQASRLLYDKVMEESIEDLSTVRWDVLRFILKNGVSRATDIEKETGKRSQNISTYLKDLNEKELIREIPRDELRARDLDVDKRSKYYEVTAKVEWLKLKDKVKTVGKEDPQDTLDEFTGSGNL